MILIDTDVCIELLRGNKRIIDRRAAEDEDISVSFMTVAELYYGAEKSGRKEHNMLLVEQFILTVEVIESNVYIMRKFAELKATLEKAGSRLADADLFIAATAILLCSKLITGNSSHYGRIDGLKMENWLQA